MTFLNDYASSLFSPFLSSISSLSTYSILLLKLIIYLSTRTIPLSVHHEKFFLFLCNYHTISPSLFSKSDIDIINSINNQSNIKNEKNKKNKKSKPYKNTYEYKKSEIFDFFQINNEPEVYNNYNRIKEFMFPYTTFSHLITLKTFEAINEIVHYEKQLVTFTPFPQNSQICTLLKNINSLQKSLTKTTINYNSTIEEVKSKTKLLIELERTTNIYFSSIGKLINSHTNFNHLMWNKNNYIWKKKFTQNTILLNIDLMLSNLNNDTINYIKTFIEPSFLKSVRIYLIRNKYFPYPKQQITNYLHSFTLPQLHNIYKLYYTIFINTEELLKYLPNIHLINKSSLVYDYFDIYLSAIEPNISYDTTFSKKNIIKLLTDDRIINFFDFQKTIYIIYQIRKEKRFLNYKTPKKNKRELFEKY